MNKSVLQLFLCLITLLAINSGSNAQTENAKTSRLKIGVRLGPSMGKPIANGESPFIIFSNKIYAANAGNAGNGGDLRSCLGTSAGIYGVIKIGKNISWRTEAGFLSKQLRDSYKIAGWDSLYNVPYTYSGAINYACNYIEFPNMISFHIPGYSLKPYFSAGVSPCFLISALKKERYNSFSGSDESKNTLMALGFPLKDRNTKLNAKPFNIQLVLAAGNNVRLSKSLQLNFEIRYYADIMKVFDYSFGTSSAAINFMTFTGQTGLVYNFAKNNDRFLKPPKKYIEYKEKQLKLLPKKDFPLNHLSLYFGITRSRTLIKDVVGPGVYDVSPSSSGGASIGVGYIRDLNNNFFIESGLNLAFNSYNYKYTYNFNPNYGNHYTPDKNFIYKGVEVPLGVGIQKNLFASQKVKLAISAGPKVNFILKGLSNYTKDDTLTVGRDGSGQIADAFILHQGDVRVMNPGGYLKASVFLRRKSGKYWSFSLMGQCFSGKAIAHYEGYDKGKLSDYGNIYSGNRSIRVEVSHSLIQLKPKKKKKQE